MNTYAYEYFSLSRKAVPLRHCFTYVHAGSFLGTKHGPEGGRGDDKATGNSLFDIFLCYWGNRGMYPRFRDIRLTTLSTW